MLRIRSLYPSSKSYYIVHSDIHQYTSVHNNSRVIVKYMLIISHNRVPVIVKEKDNVFLKIEIHCVSRWKVYKISLEKSLRLSLNLYVPEQRPSVLFDHKNIRWMICRVKMTKYVSWFESWQIGEGTRVCDRTRGTRMDSKPLCPFFLKTYKWV